MRCASFCDVVFPSALLRLKSKDNANEWAELEFTRMSPKGQASFKALMRTDHMADAGRIIVTLADAQSLPADIEPPEHRYLC